MDYPAFQRAVRSGKLAEVSRLNYETRLNLLQSDSKKSLIDLIKHPRSTFRIIIKKSAGVHQTSRAYITAILALFKHDSNLLKAFPSQYLEFKDLFGQIDAVVQDRYDSNTPSDKQRASYLPWSQLILKRDGLPRDSNDYLFICLYSMIPPLRADFGNVRILSRDPAPPESLSGNYIVVRPKDIRLVLNDFKSKSEKHPQYNHVLPQDLEAVIRDSLARQPRSHLIVSPRSGKPYLRDNSYVLHAHRTLERVLGIKSSLSMLRHMFINSLDLNKLTTAEKKRISSLMTHSPDMQEKYRLLF